MSPSLSNSKMLLVSGQYFFLEGGDAGPHKVYLLNPIQKLNFWESFRDTKWTSCAFASVAEGLCSLCKMLNKTYKEKKVQWFDFSKIDLNLSFHQYGNSMGCSHKKTLRSVKVTPLLRSHALEPQNVKLSWTTSHMSSYGFQLDVDNTISWLKDPCGHTLLNKP